MPYKIRVLFVVDSMFKAGAERFTYEINSSLNKNIFNVDLLSLKGIKFNHIYLNTDQYYFEKHKKLGSNIFFLENFLVKIQKNIFLANLSLFLRLMLVPSKINFLKRS
jgi:hypothetical protein